MRYFLGLDLSPTSKLNVAHWREQALPQLDKLVPPANFHITLSFLGQVPDTTLDMLCAQMDNIECGSISVELDQMGYWAKPKILFLAPSHVPKNLRILAKITKQIANNCQIDMRRGDYNLHLTIARGLKNNPPCELFKPSITCTFDNVHLFESVPSKHGVCYPIRKSWSLRPSFSF